MTELLLNAILNLFALSAARLPAPARAGVGAALERYLRRHLRLAQPQVYLELFSEALALHQEREPNELTAQAARVAATLRAKLPRLEQYVLLLRLLELRAALGAGADDAELIQVVTSGLEISPEVARRVELLCRPPWPLGELDQHLLLPDPGDLPPDLACRRLARPGFQGRFCVLALAEVEALCLAVAPGPEMTLDSIPLDPGLHLLPPGGVLRDTFGERIYQAEIAAALAGDQTQVPPIVFRGQKVDFRYPGTEIGLHDFSFEAHGGQMVGVMGGSGAGKSTLLGILNGRQRPDSGRVLVNGVDLHRQAGELEGVIGYVPQDDLLFDDLTVFDNLYFAAGLCLANLSPSERVRRVEAVLAELNQAEIRDLKVGSPLDKTISGGQRKRLNIALELIREPAILFVDEPTSGLSSADSENVMTLLKAQAAQGKLVIVVIHQPSSRIYKMFDALWLLDRGGRPIFEGNPLDALVYFRQAASAAGQDEYACPHCGQVNPEQLFEIIEERAVDDQGRYTAERRVSPQVWHQRHLARAGQAGPEATTEPTGRPERRLWRPGAGGQLAVFFRRNLKSRLANRMYLGINLIEPPLLAVLAALLCRGSWGGDYSFGDNANLGIFFFISVVVALFLGLSVSAEEINRDRKILERERFLNLSWPAYVAAKTLYLALVSALQMAVYVVISHAILAVPDLGLTAWLVLFACAMVSCLVGLNISAALKSAVTIYILIPLLLVPQIMLGGAVVPYDELTWRNADQRHVPLVADLMPSRWGYEALVMAQFTGNRYYAFLMADDCAVRQSDYLTDRYLYELRGLADYPFMAEDTPAGQARTARALAILAGEMPRLARRTGLDSALIPTGELNPTAYSRQAQARIKELLDQAEAVIRARRQAASERLTQAESRQVDKLGRVGLARFKARHQNRELTKLALNQQTLEDYRLGRSRVVQVTLPACQEPESPWGQAQFLAAHKRLGPWRLATSVFDLGILALMGLVAYAALYLALLPRLLAGLSALAEGLRHRRKVT